MSRKPDTPRTDDTPAGTGSELTYNKAGRRFSANSKLLAVERELAADGADVPNRAIPIKYHAPKRTYTEEEIRTIIESELDNDAPNRQLIGYLNEVKAEL